MTRRERIQESIHLIRRRAGLTVPQFAEAIGMSEGCFRDHYRNPDSLRLGEITAIERVGSRYGISIIETLKGG